MSLDALAEAAGRERLEILGLCLTVPDDGLGQGTLALLGPAEPGFWDHVTQAVEFKDGAADPLDRWSSRVLTDIAQSLGGAALFPFGKPARPFIGWAIRSGRAWVSPVGLLVHDTAGLLISYRGAVLFKDAFDLPPTPARPCEVCTEKPCLTACPVSALSLEGYDIPACHRYLDGSDEVGCNSRGCAVRRSCPISRRYPRDPAQSAFHMAAFHTPRHD